MCTDIGGHAAYAIHSETALLVQPKNVIDMADKLCRLLKDNEMRVKLAENGHKYIRKFSWEENVIQIEKIFESLVSNYS